MKKKRVSLIMSSLMAGAVLVGTVGGAGTILAQAFEDDALMEDIAQIEQGEGEPAGWDEMEGDQPNTQVAPLSGDTAPEGFGEGADIGEDLPYQGQIGQEDGGSDLGLEIDPNQDAGYLLEDGMMENDAYLEDAISMETYVPQQQEEAAQEDTLGELMLILEEADPSRMEQMLKELEKIPSPTGSDGELEIAWYIEDYMEKLGYTISEQNFHEGFLNADLVDVPGMNILAERGANSANPTNDILIVCTHYDSKTDSSPDDPMANDKTGVAVLLETARILAEVETDVDVCFVFLSGEEDGYYGSVSFVQGIEAFLDRIVGVIGVGPLGQIDPKAYRLSQAAAQTADGETLAQAETETEAEEEAQAQLGRETVVTLLQSLFPCTLALPYGEENLLARRLAGAARVEARYVLQQEEAWLMSGETQEDWESPEEAMEGGEEWEEESTFIPQDRFDWELTEDTLSSCSSFARAGKATVLFSQPDARLLSKDALKEEGAHGAEEETDVEAWDETEEEAPDETEDALTQEPLEVTEKELAAAQSEALAQAANILARAIGMYMQPEDNVIW